MKLSRTNEEYLETIRLGAITRKSNDTISAVQAEIDKNGKEIQRLQEMQALKLSTLAALTTKDRYSSVNAAVNTAKNKLYHVVKDLGKVTLPRKMVSADDLVSWYLNAWSKRDFQLSAESLIKSGSAEPYGILTVREWVTRTRHPRLKPYLLGKGIIR